MPTHIFWNLMENDKTHLCNFHSALPLFTSLTLLTIPQNSSLFHSPLIFWHFPVCRLLSSSRFWSRIRLHLYWAVRFRVSPSPLSSHILISIYHLLRTLLMPPFFSHFTTVPPSFFFFCQPSRAFLTFAFHRPFILHANHFPLPLPCLPALSPAHCCSRSFCSFSSFPRSTIGGIDSLCSIITVPPKDQQHKSTAASLLRPDAMLNLIKGGNINDSIFLREVWMERIVSYCLVDSAVTFCRFESSLVGVARAFFLFDSSWASFWKNFFWRSQRCKNLKAEHDGVG